MLDKFSIYDIFGFLSVYSALSVRNVFTLSILQLQRTYLWQRDWLHQPRLLRNIKFLILPLRFIQILVFFTLSQATETSGFLMMRMSGSV